MNEAQHDFGMKYGHAPVAHNVIAVDFDSTLVFWQAIDYEHTEALPGAKEAVNELYDLGYKIVIFTSRLSPTWHESSGEDGEEQLRYVQSTLERLGIKYHYVTGEKVPAIAYLDDKAINYNGDWSKVMASFHSGIATDDLAWSAALVDGEGSIVFRGVNQVILQLSMSDEDAVDKIQSIFGTGSRWTEHRPGKKPIYGWRVHSASSVRFILKAIMPWLGKRRKLKAEEALERINRNQRVKIQEMVGKPTDSNVAYSAAASSMDRARNLPRRVAGIGLNLGS